MLSSADDGELDLSALQECSEVSGLLKGYLRECCLERRVRRERHIFLAALKLLAPPLRRFSVVMSLQEVLAGLVLLAHDELTGSQDEGGGGVELPFVDPAELLGQLPGIDMLNRQTEYISERERRAASSCLLQIALLRPEKQQEHEEDSSPILPSVSVLLRALYPLLTPKAAGLADASNPSPSMSTVAEDLFSQSFLKEKKRLVVMLLDSLLWRSRRGLPAALKAFVLDDGISDSDLLAAVENVVQLVCHAPRKALKVTMTLVGDQSLQASMDLLDGGGGGVHAACDRLAPIFYATAASIVEDTSDHGTSRGARAPAALIPLMKNEERLHVTLLLVANALVAPLGAAGGGGGGATSAAITWAKLNDVNKYLLGPLFSPLKSAGRYLLLERPAELVITALHHRALLSLAALMHGATMCSSAKSLLVVWDVACRGFVVLCHLSMLRRKGAPASPRVEDVDNDDHQSEEETNDVADDCHVVCSRLKSLLGALTMNVKELAFPLAATSAEAAVAGRGEMMHTCLGLAKSCSYKFRLHFVTFVLERCVAAQADHGRRKSSATIDINIGDESLDNHEHRVIDLAMSTLDLLLVDGSEVIGAPTADGAVPLFDALSQLLVLVPASGRMVASLVLTVLEQILPRTEVDGSAPCIWILGDARQRFLKCMDRLRRHFVAAKEARGEVTDDREENSCFDTIIEQLSVVLERLTTVENKSTAGSGANHRRSEEDDLSLLCSELNHALSMRLVAPTAILTMRLLDTLESTTSTTVKADLLQACLRTLKESDDTCVAVKAVRCVALIALRRIGPSSDHHENLMKAASQIIACVLSMISPPSPAVGEGLIAQNRMVLTCLRLLDVLLCVCDEDGGDCLTIRGFDEAAAGSSVGRSGGGLFDVVEAVCHAGQSSQAVRTAALHLCGHLGLALYPRVLPRRVVSLAMDVFRLGHDSMCRAAAASMLAHVVLGLKQRQSLADLADLEVEALCDIAGHMSQFHSRSVSPQNYAEKEVTSSLDDEVVRQHGRDVLAGLREMSLSLVQPADGNGAGASGQQSWESNKFNIWRSNQ